MQLNKLEWRQRSINGAILASFFVKGQLNPQPTVYEDQIIVWVNNMEKMMNDVQDQIR